MKVTYTAMHHNSDQLGPHNIHNNQTNGQTERYCEINGPPSTSCSTDWTARLVYDATNQVADHFFIIHDQGQIFILDSHNYHKARTPLISSKHLKYLQAMKIPLCWY